MKYRTKLSALLAATLLIGLMGTVGCGTKEAEVTEKPEETVVAEETATAEETEITFWHHYSSDLATVLDEVLIPKFEEENPGIKVNAVTYEWAGHHDKILISAKSNTLPDVSCVDSAWVPELKDMGIVVPLNQEMDDFTSTADSLLASAMSTAEIGGDTYGLALTTNTKIMYYNVEAFEAAGISVPTTMEEFVEACKVLAGTNAGGQQVWGYEEPGLGGWNLCPFIWSFGGEITDPEQKVATGYLNSEETVAAIQMFKDLYDAGYITGWNSGDIPMTDGFGTGRYAMIMDGAWKSAELATSYPDFKYGTADMPAGAGGSIGVLGGEDLCMYNTANKDAAWKFMQFMTGEFAQTELVKCAQIPVNKVVLDSDVTKEADFAPYLNAIQTAKSRPTVSCWTEIDGELSTAVSAVMNGEKTAQEAMDELAAKVDAMLAE